MVEMVCCWRVLYGCTDGGAYIAKSPHHLQCLQALKVIPHELYS